MDSATIIGLLSRNVGAALSGFLVQNGLSTADAKQSIIGAVGVGLTIAWSVYQKYGQKKLLGEVAKMPPLPAHVPNDIAADIVTKAANTGTSVNTVARLSGVDLAGKVGTGGAGVILLCMLLLSSHDAHAQRLQRDDAQVTTGSDQGVAKIGAIIGRVKQFTINDLTSAAADADNQVPPDPAGDCWRALIPVIQTQQSLLPAGLGLAQAIQKARDLQRRAQRGVSDDIKAKCAIVLWDAEAALIKLGVNIAPVPKLPGLPF